MQETTTGSPPWDNDPMRDTTSTACLPQYRVTKKPSGEVKWVKGAQTCPTLCNPIDYRVHEILQARILEWVAYPFSRGSSQPRDWIQVSCMAGRFFPGELQGKLRFKNHQVGSCKGKTVDFNKTLKKKKKNRKYEFAEIYQRNSPRERGVPFSLHDNDVINTVD